MAGVAAILAAAGIGYAVTRKPGEAEPPAVQHSGRAAIASLRKRVQGVAPGQAGAWNGDLWHDRREDNPGTSVPREQADALLAKAKEKLEGLDDEGRKKVCQELKKQYPDNGQIQAIDCDDTSTAQIVNAAIVVSAAAAGTALCGPVCGTAGGMIGGAFASAYGEDIAEFIDDAYAYADELAADALDLASDGVDFVLDLV